MSTGICAANCQHRILPSLDCCWRFCIRCFRWYDENGDERPLEDSDDALERWKELWENRKFPVEVITEYLESQRESFYLFHPERPFYQCEHAKAGTEYSASKLNGNLSESSNKLRLFTDISGKAKEEMTFAEAARWLLYVNAYDDTSAKPSGEARKQGISTKEKMMEQEMKGAATCKMWQPCLNLYS